MQNVNIHNAEEGRGEERDRKLTTTSQATSSGFYVCTLRLSLYGPTFTVRTSSSSCEIVYKSPPSVTCRRYDLHKSILIRKYLHWGGDKQICTQGMVAYADLTNSLHCQGFLILHSKNSSSGKFTFATAGWTCPFTPCCATTYSRIPSLHVLNRTAHRGEMG